ncbi:hypothetical protein C2S51_035610 [Perilla frutescens var. frutescens]|nr:hypothetical protein C2S51_035610 [Perilla frutescens var. frutescens]
MHGQGNYSIQVGQDPYVRPPAFQQHPATAAPPATSHYSPHAPQPQVIQHAHPSFHTRPGSVTYQHAMTSAPHLGQPAPVVSGGMSYAQPYLHHPRPPQISNQISHSYPTIEQQPLLWSQNVHQLPPPPPPQGQSAYQLPSSQGHTLERGPSHQHPPHAPPPPLPPYSSSSTVLTSDPVPPIPPSSPSSNFISKKEGNYNWKGLPDGDNLASECPPPGKPTDVRSVHENVPFQRTESGINEGSVDAEAAAHSPTDSDMDMEDDITYPDEEKKNCLSVYSNDERGSMSQEVYMGEKLQPLQHSGCHILPEISIHENLSSAEASVAKAKGGDSEVVSDCNFPVTMKLSSRAESGMPGIGQNGSTSDAGINESPSRHKNFGHSRGPVVHPETGYGELPDHLTEGANPLKILHGYSSNNTSDEDENLGVVVTSMNDVSSKSDAEKGRDFESDLYHKSLPESNKHLLPESVIKSPRNVMEADKLAIPTGIVKEFSDRSQRGQEPVSSGLEEANAHKPDMKSDKLKVDEFGRLVREDVSDSDTSDSPPYGRRHVRRARKRSRSQSRSRSPHDRRRRRRSPWRRKERRGRSRSLSPRRRSRSRSPVLRRDIEFGGDKLKWEKGQHPACFNFLRGKCYRGADCRYSHHESDKSERSRNNRGKQHNRDAPPTLQNPDFHEGKVLTEKEMKDKGHRLSQDMPGLREAKDSKRLPVDSASQSPDKMDNLSGYPAHDTPSDKCSYLFPESAAKYSDSIPQVVDQQGKMTDDSLLSESSSLAQALAGTPPHHPTDKPDAQQDPTSQPCSVENHSLKPYSNQKVPSWFLNPSIANHSSQLTIPLPSASHPVNASFAQPILQDYNSNPPTSQSHRTPENYLTYEAPVAYQHSHFPRPLKLLSSSFLPPPPPAPVPTSVEHSIPSQHLQQSLLPPWNGPSSYTSMSNQPNEMPNRSLTGEYQAYPFAREPDQMRHITDGFGSSSLTTREGGPRMMGADHLAGDPVQGFNSSKSFTQAQINPLLRRSPIKGMHSSLSAGLPSESNSSHGRPYFQQASYGLQYSAGGDVYAKLAEPGMVSSSASRTTQDFLERNHSYVHGFIGSKISNYFNPYASTFDVPLSSKFSSNTLVPENDATINTTYGTPVGLSSVPVDPHRTGSVGSKNMISSSSVLPAEHASRPGGNQYDPLFDSIEPTSNSFSKADHLKHEITGDSDDVLRFHGSGKLLNKEAIKKEGETFVSVGDSLEKEECGETADVAAGAVLDGTPSNPTDATDVNVGEFEIDQVKTSGKKKKSKERSMKHFKISIAAFVKEVLKPSWRQGNMSKEAFKTIVKKTVDKVSGAMKSHQIPKSQAKINHYIDSSRGKLTKLVMGYVDKYVKEQLTLLMCRMFAIFDDRNWGVCSYSSRCSHGPASNL